MLLEFDGLKPETLKEGFTVVQYYADWCGPCNRMKPVLSGLSDEESFKDIKFHKVNTDQHKLLTIEEGVVSLPTIIIYKDGTEIDRKVGFYNKETTRDWISANRN